MVEEVLVEAAEEVDPLAVAEAAVAVVEDKQHCLPICEFIKKKAVILWLSFLLC